MKKVQRLLPSDCMGYRSTIGTLHVKELRRDVEENVSIRMRNANGSAHPERKRRKQCLPVNARLDYKKGRVSIIINHHRQSENDPLWKPQASTLASISNLQHQTRSKGPPRAQHHIRCQPRRHIFAPGYRAVEYNHAKPLEKLHGSRVSSERAAL